ncbi:hypothetical protein CSA80_01770 [Candidatus Saccharibacteria bacterium]|nr:MAG: hypothetical protein CSA80_01770 [Candidatus Saccharibacteria bacterium]
MRRRISFFLLRLKISARATGGVLRQWRYALLAVLVATLFFELVYWLFNLETLGVILGSSAVSFGEKLSVLASPFRSVRDVNGNGTVTLMLVLAVIQGVNVSLLAYAMRHQQKADAKLIGGSSLTGLLAVIGLGCPACGTSLLTPIIAMFASSSALAVSERLTAIALPIAVAVGLFGVYVLGLRLSTIRAQKGQQVQDKT